MNSEEGTVCSIFHNLASMILLVKMQKRCLDRYREWELHYLKFLSKKQDLFVRLGNAEHYFVKFTVLFVAAEMKGWFTIDKQTIKIAPFKLSEKGIEIKPKSSRNMIKDAAVLWGSYGGNILEIDAISQRLKVRRYFLF